MAYPSKGEMIGFGARVLAGLAPCIGAIIGATTLATGGLAGAALGFGAGLALQSAFAAYDTFFPENPDHPDIKGKNPLKIFGEMLLVYNRLLMGVASLVFLGFTGIAGRLNYHCQNLLGKFKKQAPGPAVAPAPEQTGKGPEIPSAATAFDRAQQPATEKQEAAPAARKDAPLRVDPN